MKQASFWEPLSIRCPHVKFSTLYYWRVSAFISLVYKTNYRKAILHGGHKVVVLYMQTHCCIPKSCWVVGKGVRELFVIKNSGQLSMKLYGWYNYSSENKVCVCNALIWGWHKFPTFEGCCPENAHTEECVNTHMFGPSEGGRGQQAALLSAKV